MGRKQWLRQFDDARELAELYAMQKVEPTGQTRNEWYYARIIATLKNVFSDKQFSWLEELIGYEKPEQTPDEMLAILDTVLARVNSNGHHRKSGRESGSADEEV